MPFFPADILSSVKTAQIQPLPQACPEPQWFVPHAHSIATYKPKASMSFCHGLSLAKYAKAEVPREEKILVIFAFPKMPNIVPYISGCRCSLKVCSTKPIKLRKWSNRWAQWNMSSFPFVTSNRLFSDLTPHLSITSQINPITTRLLSSTVKYSLVQFKPSISYLIQRISMYP